MASTVIVMHIFPYALSLPPGVVLAAHGHISTLLRYADEHLHHNIRHIGRQELQCHGRDGQTKHVHFPLPVRVCSPRGDATIFFILRRC